MSKFKTIQDLKAHIQHKLESNRQERPLEFVEGSHKYYVLVNGIREKQISCSNLIAPLNPTDYGAIDDNILRRAQAKGTLTHEAIERILNKEITIEQALQEYKSISGYIDAFRTYKEVMEQDYHMIPILIEEKLHLLGVAGALDCVMFLKHKKTGQVTLRVIDWKTYSSKVNPLFVAIQLSVYCDLLDRITDLGEHFKFELSVVNFQRNGNFDQSVFPTQPHVKMWLENEYDRIGTQNRIKRLIKTKNEKLLNDLTFLKDQI